MLKCIKCDCEIKDDFHVDAYNKDNSKLCGDCFVKVYGTLRVLFYRHIDYNSTQYHQEGRQKSYQFYDYSEVDVTTLYSLLSKVHASLVAIQLFNAFEVLPKPTEKR